MVTKANSSRTPKGSSKSPNKTKPTRGKLDKERSQGSTLSSKGGSARGAYGYGKGFGEESSPKSSSSRPPSSPGRSASSGSTRGVPKESPKSRSSPQESPRVRSSPSTGRSASSSSTRSSPQDSPRERSQGFSQNPVRSTPNSSRSSSGTSGRVSSGNLGRESERSRGTEEPLRGYGNDYNEGSNQNYGHEYGQPFTGRGSSRNLGGVGDAGRGAYGSFGSDLGRSDLESEYESQGLEERRSYRVKEDDPMEKRRKSPDDGSLRTLGLEDDDEIYGSSEYESEEKGRGRSKDDYSDIEFYEKSIQRPRRYGSDLDDE